MDSKLLYLKHRANFHSRAARQATCTEARCAHQGFVRAYLGRIERVIREAATSDLDERTVRAPSASLVVLSTAAPALVA